MSPKLKWQVSVIIAIGVAVTTGAVLYVTRDAPFTRVDT